MKDNEKALQIHPVSENGTLDSAHVLLPITRKACVLENDTDNPVVFQRPITSMNEALVLTNIPPTAPEEESKATKLELALDKLYNQLKEDIFDNIYPVGSLYMSTRTDIDNPADILGFGTWERIKDTFLYAADDDVEDYNVNKTGGSNDAITVAHSHPVANANTITISNTTPLKSGASDLTGHFGAMATESETSLRMISKEAGICYGGDDSESINRSVDCLIQNHKRDMLYIDARHTHTVTLPAYTAQSVGESGTNKNMPKFLCVKIWKRVADN